MGTYTITVFASTCGDSKSASYTVSVESCLALSVTPPTVTDISYSVGDSAALVNLGGFTVSPSTCGYTLTYSVVGDPGGSVFTFDDSDPTNLSFTVDTSTVSHGHDVSQATPKTYPATVSVINSADGSTHAISLTFDVLITDPCKSATITLNSAIVPTDTLNYSIGDPADSLAFVPVGNISNDSVTTNPVTLCADLDYEYTLVDATAAPTYSPANNIFTFDSVALTLSTETVDSALVGTHSLALGVKFAGTAYTTYVYQSFTKTILAPVCGTASISLPSDIVDQTGSIP